MSAASIGRRLMMGYALVAALALGHVPLLVRQPLTNGEGVDAIMAFPHNYGCSQLGDDHENTKKILRDMILHPNAGAVLIVSLGCENNQPDVSASFG